ncbi:helix-turn-helix transcriptional regulator [Microtetraspora sp. NBRC 16547]|uniref:helix-turn-helix domain-containing protein n=1 Tax=Microtetraspora sp. NBRC 16547 TaxID=3030993 RepID=UPI0024A2D24D|nr:helix-turn-helix transcriptional regulator [Microtetraspora sp. NBRC 16547]GLW98231.1 hypothetical protein Misp02_23180 [Microtetraspora sp. NBRC 16547]
MSIVAELITVTKQLGIKDVTLAGAVGVHPGTVSRWRCGSVGLSYSNALAWAAYIERRLAAVDEAGDVVAEGEKIPGQLRALRERAGLVKGEVAERSGMSVHVVAYHERAAHSPFLGTIDRQLSALGYRLALLISGRPPVEAPEPTIPPEVGPGGLPDQALQPRNEHSFPCHFTGRKHAGRRSIDFRSEPPNK